MVLGFSCCRRTKKGRWLTVNVGAIEAPYSSSDWLV